MEVITAGKIYLTKETKNLKKNIKLRLLYTEIRTLLSEPT